MLFEKAIRKRQGTAPERGHSENDSDVTSGLPIIQLEPQSLMPSFIDELMNWPDKIEVLAQWSQVSMGPEGVMAQEVMSGEPLQPRDMYEPNTTDKPDLARASRYGAIALNYKNTARLYRGFQQDVIHGKAGQNVKLGILETNQLYVKPYLIQQGNMLVQQRQTLGEGRWQVTAPKSGATAENMVPLLAYGCHAPLGCELNQIEQVYASIGTNGQATTIKIYKESFLRQEGISLPQGGDVQGWRYRFVDAQVQTSLIADILNHKIAIAVTIDDITKTYVSVAYQENSQKDQFINLTFIPQ